MLKKSVQYSCLAILAFVIAGLIGFIVFFVGKAKENSKPIFNTKSVSFAELPNWQADNLTEMWPAFLGSCKKINTLPKETVLLNGSSLAEWQAVCSVATTLNSVTNANVREFFASYFTPYQVNSAGGTEGLFTGYYVPELRGSRTKKLPYMSAVYKRPHDLVMIEDLGIFRQELKGKRIAGKVVNGNLQPYHSHAEITNGALAGNELLWLADPIDAFFMQIQGSGIIKLDTGETIRLGYAGTNGHLYTSIGKILLEQKELSPTEVSMQTIRAWLNAHPDKTTALLQQNASFVFFSEASDIEPKGAQDTVLIAERSLAIDPVYIAYGTPIWLDIEHPIAGGERMQRLVVAQDKGGAIKGAIRGDLFCGTGDAAGELAGKMKSKGSYYVLLPKVKQQQ